MHANSRVESVLFIILSREVSNNWNLSYIFLPLECEEVDGGLVSEDLLSTVVLHVATHVITVQYGPGSPPLHFILHGPQVE